MEYPGLLCGLGYHHDSGFRGEIDLGFSMDYVSGLPCLPGSSVKGMLRAAFSHEDYIREILTDLEQDTDALSIKELETQIFGSSVHSDDGAHVRGSDVFMDAVVVDADKQQKIFDIDNITPHHAGELGELSEPTPLTLLKVRPNVVMRFRFLLSDVPCIAKETRRNLFCRILLDMGAGAKTNVGFGRFGEIVLRQKKDKDKYTAIL